MATIKEIAGMIEEQIAKETGAQVEVTLIDDSRFSVCAPRTMDLILAHQVLQHVGELGEKASYDDDPDFHCWFYRLEG